MRSADRISVLRQGRIVEHATHEQVMANAGLYAELFTLQAAAYQVLYRSKLCLVAGWGYTTGDIRAYLLRAQAAEGVKPALLVVDYV